MNPPSGRSAAKMPKYQQVARALLAEHSRDPAVLRRTQKELARDHGVHLLTLRHALAWLDREGHLTHLAGRTFVGGREASERVVGYPLWTESLATLNIHRSESRLATLQDIHAELARQGYTLDPHFVGPPSRADRKGIRELCARWSAVILEPFEGESRIDADHPFHAMMDRAVLVGAIQDRSTNCVCPDFYAGGQLAVEEFLRSGARRILYTGQRTQTVAHRLLRVLSAEDALIPHPEVEILYAGGGLHAEEAFSAVKRFFLEGGKCDAILSEFAYATCGALRALADLKIAVPGDVQVISIGASPQFAFMTPRPTVIAPEPHRFGQEIARMAMALCREGKPRPNILIPMQLVQGETTTVGPTVPAPRGKIRRSARFQRP